MSMRSAEGHVSVPMMALSAVLGAVFAFFVPALVFLAVDREPSVRPADLEPLTRGVQVLGGVPRIPEDPGVLTMLLTHERGARAALRRLRDNAEAEGWRRAGDTVMLPGGECVSFQEYEAFLADASSSDLEDAVRRVGSEQSEEELVVLIAVARC